VGPDGPILLQDHYLIEQMANFNRERIPERQPHAKGGGAFGHFEVTADVSQFTKAAVFQPGTETDTLIRFSTVAGERGSPDTWRDPRGFALKFYTSEGNYDMVGNNTPVFFLRDPMKFQHFIRSQKRRADSDLRDHDMQWDFWSLSPESAHQVTMLMGDRGIPKSWRHMNGYSSHTYMWVNANGERFWVKYHFKTDQGIDFLTQEDADRIAGEDGDYHRRDLFDAIRRGDYPSWTLRVQIMPFEEARAYRFNPFDLTKVWPHGDYPLHEVGRLTLDRNPTDFHTEIEQAAFEPNNLVPGIGVSPDKMLLARVFSYADAHRARMGVNYKQIPVNAPQGPVHSYSKDGAMRIQNVSDPVYAPNSKGGPAADPERYPYVEKMGCRRRVRPRRLHPAPGRRRLGPGRHARARGHGRRPAGSSRLQRGRASEPGGVPAGPGAGSSSTGATSTRSWPVAPLRERGRCCWTRTWTTSNPWACRRGPTGPSSPS
jgi:catalase